MKQKPKPPQSLTDHAAKFFARVVDDYAVDDAAGLELVAQAAHALDRAEAARALVTLHGVAVVDRWGQLKTNPATLALRDAEASFRASLKALGLEDEPAPIKPTRPTSGGR